MMIPGKQSSYPIAYYRARAEVLGYGLYTDITDDMGRKWKYCTGPNASGGTTSYFNDKADLDRYLSQVELNRKWQAEWDERRINNEHN